MEGLGCAHFLSECERSSATGETNATNGGRILCGKVRYAAEADPVFTAVCHCKNCQKQAGTSSSVVVAIPASAFSVTGPMKTFEDTGDSGKPVHRNFCPDCGSPITSVVDAMPGLTFIKAGTLDDPSWLKPTMEVYCDSAQPWITYGGGLQRFAKMPG
jgi:hypothetical protein